MLLAIFLQFQFNWLQVGSVRPSAVFLPVHAVESQRVPIQLPPMLDDSLPNQGMFIKARKLALVNVTDETVDGIQVPLHFYLF